MITTPRVSVIIIFFNTEVFLGEAVESVLVQTFDDWELLLVDDGSSDGSTRIARDYADRFPDKVRYLEHANHENRGMSASRNVGLHHARGEYIGFLDGDDVYLPEKLARHVELLDSQPMADVVYGATQYWYSWTGRPEDIGRDRLRRQGVPSGSLVEPPDLVRLFLTDRARTPTTCGVLLRRSAIERVGGFEERFRGMFEDQVFFYKLGLHCRFYVDDGCWDRYRQHPSSWSHRMRRLGEWDPGPHASPARSSFLAWVGAYFRQQEVSDPELWAILRREVRRYRRPQARLLGILQRTARRWRSAAGRFARH